MNLSNNPHRESGFSLIEMMVVVAIIALLSLFIVPSISGFFRVSLSSTSRELAGVIKESFNASVVTRRVHRLVYDLDSQEYWVESGPETSLLDTSESKEKEERKKKLLKTDEKEAPSQFSIEKTITRKKKSLPNGVKFEDVFTEQYKTPVIQGKVYTHFFPHGVTEQTLIHLTNSSNQKMSLSISTFLGKTTYDERYVELQEVFPNVKK
ncbi:MAG: prepilin-type N-terminal cleavage/methylation domain-containing protein [Xanthomonadaceae bacterium]|nr:prepilin-type N-terminal cleavage/methylation domain-containing protein [Xanthomonadaceae bacterium]